jgi:hypothetical protein
MSISTYAKNKVKAMTVFDIGVLKLLLFVTGLIFGAYYSLGVLNNIKIWYVAWFILLFVMLYKWFKKK